MSPVAAKATRQLQFRVSHGTTSGATNTLRLIDRRFSMRPCSSCPSKTARTVATPNVNAGGNVNSIGDLNDIGDTLTINGNDPASGSDWLYVDDTGDTLGNTGTLTSTTLTGLGMALGITYGTIEHLVISLGAGADTFTIESTHTNVTNLDANNGDDTINVWTISGPTTATAPTPAKLTAATLRKSRRRTPSPAVTGTSAMLTL